jgi:SH3 domain-containing YSC84-like protein 1
VSFGCGEPQAYVIGYPDPIRIAKLRFQDYPNLVQIVAALLVGEALKKVEGKSFQPTNNVAGQGSWTRDQRDAIDAKVLRGGADPLKCIFRRHTGIDVWSSFQGGIKVGSRFARSSESIWPWGASNMRKKSVVVGKRVLSMLGVGFLGLASISWAADKDQSDIEKRIDNASKVLNEIMATPDKAIPDKIMSGAKCVAVIPSMVKIAVGFGGNHGKGVASCRTSSGRWSGLAPITITGGSWGLQLGGQAVDLVMIVTNDDGMQHLLSSKFKIGADASAAAGPVGRDAGADTDWKMKAQLLTYSRARGLFAGIDLSGSVVTQDKDETQIVYGKFVPFGDILEGKVRRTSMSQPFLATLAKYSGEARAERQTVARQTAPHNSVSHTKSVTGCLQAGDQPGQFSLTGADGRAWVLESKVVKLDAHVGHEVTATGYVRATKTTENKDAPVEQAAGREHYGDLRVASVKMVSDTCK